MSVCFAAGAVGGVWELPDSLRPVAAVRRFWRDVRFRLGADIHLEPISGSFRRQSGIPRSRNNRQEADIDYRFSKKQVAVQGVR